MSIYLFTVEGVAEKCRRSLSVKGKLAIEAKVFIVGILSPGPGCIVVYNSILIDPLKPLFFDIAELSQTVCTVRILLGIKNDERLIGIVRNDEKQIIKMVCSSALQIFPAAPGLTVWPDQK